MQKTEKLGMNLFESGDPVLAENFNLNTTILETELNRKCGISHGSWAGDDTANKVLTFERKPALVFIYGPIGVSVCINGAPYAFQHNFTYSQLMTLNIYWDNEANTMTLQDSGYFNQNGSSYTYVAFLEN